MAKKINILSAGSNIPFADAGLKLSKQIKISEIEEHPDFKTLFVIDEEVLQRIKDSMTKNGFDNSQPVHIWHVIDENGTEHFYLIDGYTRLAALKELGMETVPYYEHKFADFEEAFSYVLGLQVNRRNLSGPELLKNVSKLLGTDFVQNAEGKKSEVIADVLGVSDRTVEKAIAVSEEADEETLAKVESGELSVNKAYKQTKEKARKAKADDEELSDSLSDNSGNPAGLNFNHSDGIERPNNRLSDKEDNERTRERKTAYELGFTEGFLQAANHILMKILHGVDNSAIYIGLFCNKHNMEYDSLRNCIGNDPAQCYEYNDFRKKLFEERPKLKDLNPMPLEDFNTEEQNEDEDAQYLDFGKENEDSENTAEYEETENESSIKEETESDDEAFDLGFGDE